MAASGTACRVVSASSVFGHPPAVWRAWLRQVRAALRAGATTPFFLFAASPYADSLRSLEALNWGRPVRSWLSAKTQPLPPLWRWWRRRGGGIEVVSEFEFRAAWAEGFRKESLLINGPAKHRWLPAVSRPGLRVNFDSLGELTALLPWARRHQWRTGLRVRTPGEVDPEFPSFPTQFGLEPDEVPEALRRLRRSGLDPETVHFHLRTNVPEAASYAEAIRSIATVCARTGWQPAYLDLGGGLPPPFTRSPSGRRFDQAMCLPDYAAVGREAVDRMPFVRELWLENGRFLSAGSGVLVIRILDVKERGQCRILIGDGGRTLNALVSTWEDHELLPLEPRRGRRVLTAVHGPTCMAFDCLGRRPLPASLRPGDHLVWLEAGAYHLPWETRFSHGLASVWWEDEDGLREVRKAESFAAYWSVWESTPSIPKR